MKNKAELICELRELQLNLRSLTAFRNPADADKFDHHGEEAEAVLRHKAVYFEAAVGSAIELIRMEIPSAFRSNLSPPSSQERTSLRLGIQETQT